MPKKLVLQDTGNTVFLRPKFGDK